MHIRVCLLERLLLCALSLYVATGSERLPLAERAFDFGWTSNWLGVVRQQRLHRRGGEQGGSPANELDDWLWCLKHYEQAVS